MKPFWENKVQSRPNYEQTFKNMSTYFSMNKTVLNNQGEDLSLNCI